jgi:hypothetical protein
MGWVVKSKFRPLYSFEITLVTILKKDDWVPRFVWKDKENRGILALSGVRNENFPARSYTECSVPIPHFPTNRA